MDAELTIRELSKLLTAIRINNFSELQRSLKSAELSLSKASDLITKHRAEFKDEDFVAHIDTIRQTKKTIKSLKHAIEENQHRTAGKNEGGSSDDS